MLDTALYNTFLNVAYNVLSNNQQYFGRQFSELFMSDHDPNNGMAVSQNIERLYNYATRAMYDNNPTGQVNDDQLFRIVGRYVDEIYKIHTSNTNRSQFGGFSRNQGFSNNSGFGMSSRGGFGVNNQQGRPGSSSSLRDDSIDTATRPQPVIKPTQVSDIVMPTIPSVGYTNNPLDGLASMKDSVEFSINVEKPNWINSDVPDDSILIMKRESIKSSDQRFVIHKMSGFSRVYTDNELSVVTNFFRLAPQSFLAENFIIEIFYNNVEIIDAPTELFLKAQEEFIKALNRESTAYKAIINVLNSMSYGPRMALANYLVHHINRALHKCCRMSEKTSASISFSQIEDLDELLGTNFNHRILEIPNARSSLQDIVNNAIKAALSGYSSPMFTSSEDASLMPDIIRTSDAFPFSIHGVYPTKTIIPSYGTGSFQKFYNAFVDKVLSEKTYVRSIRSVVITNCMGANELPKISDKAERIWGSVAYFLSTYKTEYRGSISLGKCETSQFDELFRNNSPENDYDEYIKSPGEYTSPMRSLFVEMDVPRYPVDRSLYAIQFKKSPEEYIKAIDIVNTLDEPKEKNSGVFVQKHVGSISPVK